jgi:hypothetical protein
LLAVLVLVHLLPALSLADSTDDPAWAFKPRQAVEAPAVKRADWSRNDLDRFVLAKLEAAGLRPSSEADKATLLRRLSFDLTGLPPSPAELNAFVKDRAAGAYERVVQRLLASPHHGEHWARHWLDVVRFGESQGFEYDRIRDHAWRYRDYVIRAFNDDKPYDRFVREQIAGDVLEPVTQDGIVATGFLVAGPWDQAGNGAASASLRAAVRQAELEDIVGTVGQTFLGVTLNCARCHNHKFDPVPTRDYYRVQAVFAGVRHGDRSLLTSPERKAAEAEKARLVDQLAGLDRQLAALESNARQRAAAKLSASQRDVPAGPTPLARWTFEADANDALLGLRGTLEGGARLSRGRLVLDGKEAFLATQPLPAELREKTLEAWVSLAGLEQGGGGVVSIQRDGGGAFDAIVFAERQTKRWMAGSEGFRRTKDLETPAETAAPGELIHVAITYGPGRRVTLFRNGRPLAQAYEAADSLEFAAGTGRVLLGKRHTGGGRGLLAGEIEEARIYDRALSAEEIAASFAAGPAAALVTREAVLAALTGSERTEQSRLERERIDLLQRKAELAAEPQGYVANPKEPEPVFVLHRGEPDKARERVGPGALSALAGKVGDLGLAEDAPEAERRSRFADWVASADNPLTARVIVNRVWHYHFGRGLVATPNDFGKMGERPSHPELLDWLANWFVSPDGGNWSLKRLHQLIVTSATYRQGDGSAKSEAGGRKESLGNRSSLHPSNLFLPNLTDSENRLLSHFSPRRLSAEEVRDAFLVLSGELNPAMGGPGFRPFINKGNGGQNEYFAADLPGAEFNRRTVYRICVHSARDPLLDSLDCPEFSTRTPVRPNTTTPLQALSLMNNSFVQRQAAKLADRVAAEDGTRPQAQVEQLWQRVLGRKPTSGERREAVKLAKEQGLNSVAWVLLNSNESVFVR